MIVGNGNRAVSGCIELPDQRAPVRTALPAVVVRGDHQRGEDFAVTSAMDLEIAFDLDAPRRSRR